MNFPDGRAFAFTILDDTDDSTLENVRPVYERLRELGFRTTKTAWPMECPEGSRLFFAADTLQRREYLSFVHELVNDGFELGAHGATMESSYRERTLSGIEFFENEFGCHPRVYANHGFNRENLYWGPNRFNGMLIRHVIRMLGRASIFSGEDPSSPYFWGDMCLERIEYVRGFTYRALDLQGIPWGSPYHLKRTPFVRNWFSSTSVPDRNAFVDVVTREAVDRLEERRGFAIVSTHLGKGFTAAGRLDPAVDRILSDIAGRRGWFVPVSALLDHLMTTRGSRNLSERQVVGMEARFLLEQAGERVRAWLRP